jgi:hypothetical protein
MAPNPTRFEKRREAANQEEALTADMHKLQRPGVMERPWPHGRMKLIRWNTNYSTRFGARNEPTVRDNPGKIPASRTARHGWDRKAAENKPRDLHDRDVPEWRGISRYEK